jgi:adenosine/AMP kinase
MDFSTDGNFIVACDDITLVIYDTVKGTKIKTLFNKVHGIKLVRFTHSNEAVVCTTT